MSKITEALSTTSFDYSCLDIPESIELADGAFSIRGEIDMLLGANIFGIKNYTIGKIQTNIDNSVRLVRSSQSNTDVPCFSFEIVRKTF